LGDDSNYVKLPSTGGVEIATQNFNQYSWIFSTDGNLTIPGDIRSEGNINIDINLSDSTLHRWQFGEDGELTLPGGRTRIGTAVGVDAIIANEDEAFGVVTQGTNGSGVLIWIEDPENFSTSNLAAVYTNPEGSGTVRIATGANGPGGGPKFWTFNDAGALTFPQGTTITTADGTGAFIIDGAADKDVQIYTYSGETARGWTFGADGSLQIPGDIKSDGNINIEINIGDSTLRRWQFGEDGLLTFPDSTVQSTAWTGSTTVSSLVNGAHQVALVVGGAGPYVTFPADDGVSIGFQGGEIGIIGGEALLSSTEYGVRLSANATVDRKDWEFATDGSLTLPGDLKWPSGGGNIRSEGNINIDINLADSTLRRWQFGEDGDTVFPNNVSINYSGGNIQFPRIIADSGKAFSVQGQGTSGSAALSWTVNPDAAGQYAAVAVTRAGGGNLATVVLQAQSDSGDVGTVKLWRFDETGVFTLPAGGVISEGGGLTGAIRLTPAGGANANQALLIYPTGTAEGDHIHLTAGGGTTELYLGNDTHYVKLVNGGNVELRAATANLSAQAAWTFETDGELDTIQPLGIKVPDGVPTDVAVINSTTGSWEMNPNLSLATTGGSGSGLTVNVAETGGYASTIEIATAGTGYNNGDLITVTSGSSNATFTIVIGGRNTWQFGIDGALTTPGNITLPNGSVIKDTDYLAVAFGSGAGTISQGFFAVAVGQSAGYNGQGNAAVAIGSDAGGISQGLNAVAVGAGAGYTGQGINAVAIGIQAGYTNQGANSIIINATGATLNQTTANTFTVAPIRNISATSGVLQYNDSTKEVSYSNSVTAETFNTDQITVVGNRISTTVTNANLELECNGSGGVVINTLAEATTASTARSAGYLGIPASAVTTTATLTISDAGEHIYLTTTGQTITIPAAASVAYPIGTTLTFIAGPSATTTTIAITSDTLRLAGGTSTGSRTLAANGMATAVKVAATTWYINGIGLT
jgi:hypothetical protein